MPLFTYKAYDENGAVVTGELNASNITQAKNLLFKDKLRPVKLSENNVSKDGLKIGFSADNVVTLDDVEFVTAELSLLLESGVKIDKALSVLARTKHGSALGELLQKLSNDVRKGESLSAAMSKHPKTFDNLYLNLVTIGESSGNLVDVFSGLAEDLKYRKELKSKITQAIVYPSVILLVCVLCVLFIFNFVVPKLTVMFADAAELPIYTEILLGVSDWIQSYQIHFFIVVAATFWGAKWSLQQGHFAHKFDDILLQLPFLKNSIFLVERIRFCSSMALMLNSDVKIDQALILSAGSVKNRVISKNLSSVKDSVRKGESITSSLKQTRLFPELFMSLLEVGEESGNMAPVFNEVARRSRSEFSIWTDRMTSLIEPLMILFMGGIVGSVVVVMMMSIVSVNEIGI